ncbi:hypothetical protein V1498_08855 [Peribacillus sp. SCS-26]|uniref:hypothetical protein n=1 Tax=Paraperibacillus marinus TaxID=3115295 RepID=UPI0039064935
MNMDAVESVFDFCGCSGLFDRFKTPFYVTGLFETLEDADLLEKFLGVYDFSSSEELLFDEFRYFFDSYRFQYEKAQLIYSLCSKQEDLP